MRLASLTETTQNTRVLLEDDLLSVNVTDENTHIMMYPSVKLMFKQNTQIKRVDSIFHKIEWP